MLRSIFRALALTVLSLCALPTTVFAQGGVAGSIIGSVYDQTGQPIKGVKVVASSDTQIGGKKVSYTNDEGSFRIPGLTPGVFELTATAPKLKTALQKDIHVGLNAPAEVDLVMEIAATEQVEEIKVIEKAPIISTKTANVKEVYDEEFSDQIPVESKTAVESYVGNNVPGTVAQGERSTRIRGGASNQNSFQVEGFYMNDQKITHKALAAFEVQTAGYGAENAGVSGGVVNMVTKTGSNKFEFEINGFAEDSNMKFFLDKYDNTSTHDWKYEINPSFSGPIIKDRLWYYVNLESRTQVTGQAPDPTGFFPQGPPYSYLNFRGSSKITWQITARNQLVWFTQANWVGTKNYQRDPSYDRDAQAMSDQFSGFTGLIWQSQLTDNLLLRTQAGYSLFRNADSPELCLRVPDTCLHIDNIIQTFPRTSYSQNAPNTASQVTTTRAQALVTLEWFARNKVLGEHNFKLKEDFMLEGYESALAHVGDFTTYYNGVVPERRVEWFSNDPRLEADRHGWFIRASTSQKNTFSLTDQMRLGRYLTFTPGGAFVWATASDNKGTQAINQWSVAPSASVAWDATHDGRTVLRASFSNYVDMDVLSLARHKLGSAVSRECTYSVGDMAFGDTKGCTYMGGASGRTIGLPCGPSGVDVQGRPCTETLKIPRTWEYTLGAEREIVQGVGMGTDVVYRRYDNQYEQFETNRIWNDTGSGLNFNGGYKNGRNQTVFDLETPASAKRRYLGVTTTVHKREGAFKISTAYTWSSLRGSVLDGSGNAYGDIPPRDVYLYGYLSDDSRHQIRTTATYQATKWLTAGIAYSYQSGTPMNRYYRNEVTGQFEDLRASRGVNPGNNLNSPHDDADMRRPDIQRLNVQLRGNLKPLTGITAEAYVDILNVLALRTPIGFVEQDGPQWGVVTQRSDPFRLRFGFRYKY